MYNVMFCVQKVELSIIGSMCISVYDTSHVFLKSACIMVQKESMPAKIICRTVLKKAIHVQINQT